MPAPRGDKWETDIEARIRRLEQKQPLSNTGLSIPEPGVTQVTGNLWVTGDFTAEGKISNDALTDPLSGSVAKCSAANFGLTTSGGEKAGTDITVPAGFTRALVAMFVRMYVINPNTTGGGDGAGLDALFANVSIDGNISTATPTGVSGFNGFATTVGFDAYALTGLTPGGTIRLSASGATSYQSIAANPNNYITAVASISWLR